MEQGQDDKATQVFDPAGLAQTVRSSATVLVVDDDPRVRWTIERQLKALSAEILIVESAVEALAVLHEREVSVLVTDERMPQMTGTELLAKTREKFPGVVRVMMTGDNELRTAVRAINGGEVFRFLMKPWSMADLHEVVRAALDHHFAMRERDLFAAELERANELLRESNEHLEGLVAARTLALRRANEGLEDSLDASLRMLGAMMGLGNLRVSEQCENTRERVVALLEVFQLPEELHPDLIRAARYHWIGLLAAPEEVLEGDPTRLDPDLSAIWEFHPMLGALVLASVPALDRAARIVELYLAADRGDEDELLWLAAQMLRACSTFERVVAQTKSRGKGIGPAIERLQAERGRTIEAEVVDALLDLVQASAAPQERKLASVAELRPGMVLARMVATYSGLPMEPAFRVATPHLIERLRVIDERVGLGEIWVRDDSRS